jgi:peptide/nickel transport system substrate-binding protein
MSKFPNWLIPLLLTVGVAFAQDDTLVIGYQGGGVTMDPHMRSETTTIAWQMHVYEHLVRLERDGSLSPELATDWEAQGEGAWLVTVRDGVKWHDGSELTAEDVAFSIERARNHSKSQMKQYIPAVSGATVVDGRTVRIETDTPDPLMPLHLSQIRIVNKAYTETAGDEGMATEPMGTGPYRLVRFVTEESLELDKFEDYWGDEPDFANVRLLNIPNGSTRVAALLSGEIDIAEKVLPQDFPRIERNPDAYITQTPGNRVIYLAMDFQCESDCPGSFLPEGKNPFQDRGVRRAIYQAIDVGPIIDRVLGGAASPATQYIAPSVTNYDRAIERFPFDPEQAQALLAEAGYPDGFKVRLDAPNDRYLNDALVAQAVGGMLENAGLQIEVNTVPKAVFFPQLNEREFVMYIAGWGSSDIISTFNALVHTKDDEAGFGVVNRYRYSDPEIDALIEEANREFDDDRRAELIHQINVKSLREDVTWVPLHVENVIAGVREGIVYESNPREYLLAWEASRE